MNLECCKVVIIDDTPDEVASLINLMNVNKIAYNHYTGDLDKLPTAPFEGVRVLFLDFVLETDGQSERNKISKLIGVLRRILGRDNGPYVILAWTKHNLPADNLMPAFKTALMADVQIPRPVKIIDLDKVACLSDGTLDTLRRNINTNFHNKEIAKLLIHWEGTAVEAAAGVLKTLSDISEPAPRAGTNFDAYSNAWNRNLNDHFCQFIKAAMGQNLDNAEDMLVTLQLTLASLFQDHLESKVRRNPGPFKPLVTLISQSRATFAAPLKAKLNTFFLICTSDIIAGSYPGNVYHYDKIWSKLNKGSKRLGIKNIVLEFAESRTLASDPAKSVQYASLCKDCIPIFLEISPMCDYAQKNKTEDRFLLGILWPTSNTLNPKFKADYLYSYPPLLIQFNGIDYYAMFHSRHLYTANLDSLHGIKPIMRARRELLGDIQHWFAKHISRPGKIQFS